MYILLHVHVYQAKDIETKLTEFSFFPVIQSGPTVCVDVTQINVL